MSFFKDFKEDLSQAVSELIPDNQVLDAPEETPEEEILVEEIPDIVDTITEENASNILETLLNGLDEIGISEEEPQEEIKTETEAFDFHEPIMEEIQESEAEDTVAEEINTEDTAQDMSLEEAIAEEILADEASAEEAAIAEEQTEEVSVEDISADETVVQEEPAEEIVAPEIPAEQEPMEEVPVQEEIPVMQIPEENKEERKEEKVEETMSKEQTTVTLDGPASDENSVITEGMTVNGDIASRGSMEVLGCIIGNIELKGKLNISGNIQGNSRAAEIFADSAKITGEVVSEGPVKVGQSSVIVGNITATSAVIAGAVKGNIDVKGPVILDTSAIVMGDIKSKSVQINNGAVIEGHCSQCYAEVSPTSFFSEVK